HRLHSLLLTSPLTTLSFSSFFLLRPPPRPPLFPYTTLFRSSVRTADRRRPPRGPARGPLLRRRPGPGRAGGPHAGWGGRVGAERSEEHTSELQSRENLVCRLLLEKKKKKKKKKNRINS